MARGLRISDDLKKTIAAVYRIHSDWRIKEIQAEVDRLTNGRAPGISATQKLLTDIKSREAAPHFKNQDRPWSLGTLGDYPLPPEVIPKLLEFQRSRRSSALLTIRQARWMANLYVYETNIASLFVAAGAYAMYEENCELTGQLCDTSEFDDQLLDTMGDTKVAKMIIDRVIC